MINLITRIATIGIIITTAALIILISVFNGIESMVEKLYTEFDADVTILPAEGKTFRLAQLDTSVLERTPGVNSWSRVVEEIVVLRHEKKWVNATLMGVDGNFPQMTDMQRNIVDGEATLHMDGQPAGVIGASLLDKLGGFIPRRGGSETISVYSPKKNISMRPGVNPFNIRMIALSGRMGYNREVSAGRMVVPLEFARELFGYTDELSAIEIRAKEGADNNEIKRILQVKLGNQFCVRTNYEAFELIYKTSESEKLITIFFLFFVFILAAFNLVASITMLFVEKKDNLVTMLSFGADKKFIFRIFFYEGLLITFRGILIGALLGYAVCFTQIYGKVVTMPNAYGEPYPLHVSLPQGVVILSLVIFVSVLAAYLPVKYLIRKNLAGKV